MPAKCVDCGRNEKIPPKHRCQPCHTRRQTILVQIDYARARRAYMPGPLHRATVPVRDFPPGYRWCAGCQSFVSHKDVGRGATQCKPCVSEKNHARSLEMSNGEPITAEEYRRVFEDVQGGRCAICGGRPRSIRFAKDHDHRTNAFRGVLCSKCNHELLGSAHDSLKLLIRAVNYLRTPPAQGSWPGLDAEEIPM